MAAVGHARQAETGTYHIGEVREDSVRTGGNGLPYNGTAAKTVEVSNVTNIEEWARKKEVGDTSPAQMPISSSPGPIKAEDLGSFPMMLRSTSHPVLETRAARILRAHFAEPILADLDQIQNYQGEPIVAVYAENLLRTIREFRDQSPFEPFLEILMALHDAMEFKNRWLDYNANQYQGASKVLRSFVNQDLDNSKIEKAIVKLELLGFDTIPFCLEFDASEEDAETDT